MHISSKGSKNDFELVIENTDFFEAIRHFDLFVDKAFMVYQDKKLIASYQVIGYEIVKVVFTESENGFLKLKLGEGNIGTELTFTFEKDLYNIVYKAFNESGYFRSKLAYICDKYFFDNQNYTLVCFIDIRSNNRQLSVDRVNMLNKYLKKEEDIQKRFHDTL
jgi:hypothetical protein